MDQKVISTPVRNAFSELDPSIKSGGLTKTLDFEPQEESAGLYRAQILPTQIGSYSLLLIGKIEDQPAKFRNSNRRCRGYYQICLSFTTR